MLLHHHADLGRAAMVTGVRGALQRCAPAPDTGQDVKRFYALSLGGADCDKGRLFSPGVDEGVRIEIPVSAYLLVTDSGRRVVIDTGMHDGHVETPDQTWSGTDTAEAIRPLMRPEDKVANRLGELGLKGGDITDVINTHLHFDHAGNNGAFPNSTFHVQRDHYQQALDNPSFPNRYWRIDGLDYSLLDGETDLGDGISVFPTPGHAIGHQSVLVSLDSGLHLIVSGDAIYEEEHVRLDLWEGHADPALARRSAMELMERGRALGATILFGHDRQQRRSLRMAPEWYS